MCSVTLAVAAVLIIVKHDSAENVENLYEANEILRSAQDDTPTERVCQRNKIYIVRLKSGKGGNTVSAVSSSNGDAA